MTRTHYVQAAVAFSVALGSSLLCMPLADSIGRRFGWVVYPRLFGKGRSAISYLGGAGLALTASVAFGASARGFTREVATLLAGAFVLLAFGLADDRSSREISPPLRLGVEALAAVVVWWGGLRPDITGIPVVDASLTAFFLVAAANAFNLLDNMDGVAGATGAAASAGLFALAAMSGQYLVALLAATLCGACLGFLRHNLVGARIYLGNGGSLFLGFLIGATALNLELAVSPPWGFLAAAAVLVVPALDTSIVVMSRLIAGRSPFEGGTDHVSHRLVLLGASTKSAATFHAAASAVGTAGAVGAVVLARQEPLIAVFVLFSAGAIAFLRVRVYEPIAPDGEPLVELASLDEGGSAGLAVAPATAATADD
jgi:UDP-GlcNAc:undecaprenyl-phosphate GlcNAc-1-phosphate transferase